MVEIALPRLARGGWQTLGAAVIWAGLVSWPLAAQDNSTSIGAEVEASPGLSLPDPQAIMDAQAGKRAVVNAAWWGLDPEDATAALQAAIDTKAGKVVVPYMGGDWIVRPLHLVSNQEILFEPGVVVMANAGEFKGTGDSLFSGQHVENVTLRGYGATLRMRKADYRTDAYKKGEWRMTIDLGGCRNVLIDGLRLESSGGDGIYVGSGGRERPYCENVTIRNVMCIDRYRQGISVISAVNLLIENCVLSGTGGTAPSAGIDFEPNGPSERFVSCVMRNCVVEDNEGPGIDIYLKHLDHTSEPLSLRIENCYIRSGKDAGIVVGVVKDDGPGGDITFRDCTIEHTAKSGAYVFDKAANRAMVRFERCSWNNVATYKTQSGSVVAPLRIALQRRGLVSRVGGIEFTMCHLFDTVDRPSLLLEDDAAHGELNDIRGSIAVHTPYTARLDTTNPLPNLQVSTIKTAEHGRSAATAP